MKGPSEGHGQLLLLPRNTSNQEKIKGLQTKCNTTTTNNSSNKEDMREKSEPKTEGCEIHSRVQPNAEM